MTESIRAAMAATNSLFDSDVFGKGNIDAFDRIYTANARILPPDAAMITGRLAIKKFWKDFIAAAHAKSVILETLEATLAGDSIIEIGKATLTVQSPGQEAAQADMKYVVCWHQEDGDWKWDLDIWNASA